MPSLRSCMSQTSRTRSLGIPWDAREEEADADDDAIADALVQRGCCRHSRFFLVLVLQCSALKMDEKLGPASAKGILNVFEPGSKSRFNGITVTNGKACTRRN